MTLSRKESRRRLPAITWRLWVWLALWLAVLLIVLLLILVRIAGSSYAAEEREAVRRAIQGAGIVDVEWAFKHVWDEQVWVFLGTDADGERWMVWESPDGFVKEREADIVTEDELRARLAEDDPQRRIERMVPGWFQGEPVWEVRYRASPDAEHQSLDFYSVRSGIKRKTYELPGL
jgi:uncharacterized protein YpmB